MLNSVKLADKEPLPTLPTVAGRIRYAMGRFGYDAYSKRTGISPSQLRELCGGKAEPSFWQAKKIADCSEFSKVTEKWIFYGIADAPAPKVEQAEPPKAEPTEELPHFDKFIDRMEWARERKDMTRAQVLEAAGLYKSAYSNWKQRGDIPQDADRQAVADAVGVPKEWLFAGYGTSNYRKSTKERKKERKREKENPPKVTVTVEKAGNIVHDSAKDAVITELKAEIKQLQGQSLPTGISINGVYDAAVLQALVGGLSGKYRVTMRIDEVEQ